MNFTNKHIKKSIKWASTKPTYLNQVKKDLNKLKKSLGKANQKEEFSDIIKALKDFRYIDQSEARLNQHEIMTDKILNEMGKKCKLPAGRINKIKRLHDQIHNEVHGLINDVSLMDGEIREKLIKIRSAIKKENHGETKSSLLEATEMVNQSLAWMKALKKDPNQAKKIHLRFHAHYQGESLQDIKAKKSHLSPRNQMVFLGNLLSSKKFLDGETISTARELALKIASNGNFWSELAEVYQKDGLNEKKSWIKVGDMCKEKRRFHHAAEAYKNASKLKLAGDMCCLGQEYLCAINLYRQAGKEKEAVNAWNKLGDSLVKSSDYQKAVEHYIRAGHSKEEAWERIGKVCMSKKKYNNAAEAYKKADNWKQSSIALREARILKTNKPGNDLSHSY
tara:strand:- start:450 stop:1628 length:1179 start_codon:yes stop_codon:yes gene_type:complete